MAHRILDRVQETTTSTGTGALTLAGATSKMLSLSGAGFASGDTFWGLIEHATAAEWEIALCTYASAGAGSIARAAPLKSSTGAAVSFSAGTKTISLVAPAAVLTLLGSLEAVATPAISAGALTVDLLLGTVHKVALNADVTGVTIANALPGFASGFTVEFTADGTARTVTMPGSVTALNGTYTPSSTDGTRDLLNFVTFDGGTTWLMSIVAQNY
jgi:hypothetical protein